MAEFGLGCEYIRERKKRGKASRKDLAAQAAAQAAAGQKSPTSGAENRAGSETRGEGKSMSSSKNDQSSGDKILGDLAEEVVVVPRSQRTASLDSLDELDTHQAQHMSSHHNSHHGGHHGHHHAAMERIDRSHLESPTSLDLNGYGSVHPSAYERQAMSAHMMGGQAHGPYGTTQSSMSNYPDLPYALQTQSPTSYTGGASNSFRLATSPLSAYPIGGDAASPGWMNMSSPPTQYAAQLPQNGNGSGNNNNCNTNNSNSNVNGTSGSGSNSYGHSPLRYPVLEPLLPHLGNVIPVSLACDLVDLYFSSSSSAQMHPMSPYVLGFVFRKRSFLHPTKPRQCQPALLASMLWVAAQTSDAPFLASMPSARGKICQRLLELTVSLLKPLIHTPSGDVSPVSSPIVDGVALGGLGVALPGSISMDALTGESGPFGAAGTLDDVATYIHLATVVSASEYKGASLRWWNAAWSLARELKLGRELPHNALSMNAQDDQDLDGDMDEDDEDGEGLEGTHGLISEEEREERRRIWWLVYTVDRHLALCYNRPLFLLDIECSGLFQPMDDTDFQNGNFHAYTDPDVLASDPSSSTGMRIRGPSFQCSGHSIFGYFLPLMTILGEIVDLHHARNHPRFGINFRSSREWDEQTAEITRHLESYGESLKEFEQRHLSLSAQMQAADEKAAEAVGLSLVNSNSNNSNNNNGGNGGSNSSGSGSNNNNSGGNNSSSGGNADMPGTPSAHSVHSMHTAVSVSRLSESDVQTRIVLAYGTHVMHVLHILLYGKWDPVNLLDDNDLWISSPGFITATQHAVDAAEAIGHILEFDPGLEFMPFFFGIYLLQGSFLLLLIADKLQLEASTSVVRACGTIIRAHEACVVTLNTEYQRNFSRVMRSALAQVRGRVPEDLGEQHQRRRELLALYRWTGDGTGLAL
jgi:hypothetical protein